MWVGLSEGGDTAAKRGWSRKSITGEKKRKNGSRGHKLLYATRKPSIKADLPAIFLRAMVEKGKAKKERRYEKTLRGIPKAHGANRHANTAVLVRRKNEKKKENKHKRETEEKNREKTEVGMRDTRRNLKSAQTFRKSPGGKKKKVGNWTRTSAWKKKKE